jgi:ABC-type dipeptide/oligopeptide/nickel transport system permease subunit
MTVPGGVGTDDVSTVAQDRDVPVRGRGIRAGVRRFGRWSAKEKPAAVAMGFLALLTFAAIAASIVAPHDPLQQDLSSILAGPSWSHPFGTDELGRDMLSRVIHGGRISLATAAIAVGIAGSVGGLAGLAAGYIERATGALIMRFMDFLLAVPGILLAITIAAVLGNGFWPATIAVTVISIPAFARLARASVLSTKQEEFVQSTRSAGAGHLYLMFRTIFPNALSPLIVQASVAAATAILLEAALSFLGLGTQPPSPSWGTSMALGKSYLKQSIWYALMPGVVLTATVLSIDTIGRALQRTWGGSALDSAAGRGA